MGESTSKVPQAAQRSLEGRILTTWFVKLLRLSPIPCVFVCSFHFLRVFDLVLLKVRVIQVSLQSANEGDRCLFL